MATTYFKNFLANNIGTTAVTVYNPTDTGIQSTLIGMTLANVSTQSVTVSASILSGANTVYIIKNAVIPTGNTLNLLDANKIIIQQGNSVQIQSSTSNSVDAILSVIEVL